MNHITGSFWPSRILNKNISHKFIYIKEENFRGDWSLNLKFFKMQFTNFFKKMPSL